MQVACDPIIREAPIMALGSWALTVVDTCLDPRWSAEKDGQIENEFVTTPPRSERPNPPDLDVLPGLLAEQAWLRRRLGSSHLMRCGSAAARDNRKNQPSTAQSVRS